MEQDSIDNQRQKKKKKKKKKKKRASVILLMNVDIKSYKINKSKKKQYYKQKYK